MPPKLRWRDYIANEMNGLYIADEEDIAINDNNTMEDDDNE